MRVIYSILQRIVKMVFEAVHFHNIFPFRIFVNL